METNVVILELRWVFFSSNFSKFVKILTERKVPSTLVRYAPSDLFSCYPHLLLSTIPDDHKTCQDQILTTKEIYLTQKDKDKRQRKGEKGGKGEGKTDVCPRGRKNCL